MLRFEAMRYAGVVLGVSIVGCGALEPPPQPPQDVVVRVEADPGRSIPGAELFFNGQKISTTDEQGVGKLKLRGKDGETFDIVIKCPEGYTSPTKPTQVTLKRLADPSKSPEFIATCPPTTRMIVVAVRAEGGANLPVTYLGREVARTDSSGAAHVLLRVRPNEHFELILNTSEKGNELIRPQNPMNAFYVKQEDDVFTFSQKFDREKIKRIVRPGRPPPKKI